MSFLQRQDLTLIDYIRIVLKRRVVVTVTTLIVLALVLWQTYTTPKVFSSNSIVLVDQEKPLVDFANQRFYPALIKVDTEIQIIKSKEVASDALLNKLRWAKNVDDPRYEVMVREVQAGVRATAVGATSLIRVAGSSGDPKKAQQIANAIADAYRDVNYKAKLDANTSALDVLKKEVEKARVAWDETEKQLMEWKKANGIISRNDANRKKEDTLHAGASEYQQRKADRMEKENALNALRRWFERYDLNKGETLAIPPPGIVKSELVFKYYQDLFQAKQELDKAREVYLDKHSKVQELKRKVETLDAEFRVQIQQVLTGLEDEVDFLRETERSFERNLANESGLALEASGSDYDYALRERQRDTAHQYYNLLLEKMTETQIGASLIKNNIRVIEYASDPGRRPVPVTPNWRFNLLIGFALGLILGIAGAFFLEYIDKTFKTPDELEKYLGVPVLGVIPKMTKELYRSPYGAPELLESGEVKS